MTRVKDFIMANRERMISRRKRWRSRSSKLGAKVVHLRTQKGWTRQDLASALMTSESTIQSLEDDPISLSNLSPVVLDELAHFLETTVVFLLDDELPIVQEPGIYDLIAICRKMGMSLDEFVRFIASYHLRERLDRPVESRDQIKEMLDMWRQLGLANDE